MAIRFISVNIERDKHLDRIESLLMESNADLVCLQEVMQYDVKRLARVQGYFDFFSPTTRHKEGDDNWEGILILSRRPFIAQQVHQYAGPATPDVYDKSSTSSLRQTRRYLLQVCEVEFNHQAYRFANTHFTWSQDGQADDYQRQDVKKMLEYLQGYKSFILSGDFNAPRGREIFSKIAECYKDNIPEQYETSLDKNLHRCGYLPYMVDGLFSTPDYKIHNVELVFGVSDHAAVRAIVEVG